MTKRRSTRRDRRPPVRRPIPPRTPRTAADETSRSRGKPMALTNGPHAVLPESVDAGLYPILLQAPVDAVPLYMALAVLHQASAGKPANVCVTTCSILSGALYHLGFTAEVIAASAGIADQSDPTRTITDVGVWEKPPVVRPDGSTNGHMVLWARTFRRLVDPTIAQAPTLLAAARTVPNQAFPAVLQINDPDQLRGNQMIASARGPYVVTWTLFPHWTPILTAMVTGDVKEAVDYGALNLARTVIQQLNTFTTVRNLRALHTLYPDLGALLAGRRQLPDLPTLNTGAARLLGF
jgi:hypothetical protein